MEDKYRCVLKTSVILFKEHINEMYASFFNVFKKLEYNGVSFQYQL